MRDDFIESTHRLKFSGFKLPVFLENILSPLGHSGQPKLQAVVGSILIPIGHAGCLCDHFLDV